MERWLKRLDDLERLQPGDVMPWILIPFLSVPVALLIGVPTSGVGIGLVIGALLAFAVAAYAVRRARKREVEVRHLMTEAQAEADRRVDVVTKQYQWAVNDVANLRDALRDRPTVDEQSRAQQTEPPAIAVTTPPSDVAAPSVVRVEPRTLAAEQVRIVNANGAVVAISARALDADASGAFLMYVGDQTANAIAASEGGLRIEVLSGGEWHSLDRKEMSGADTPSAPAVPSPSMQGTITDKRGRLYTSTR
ncbi:MAG TPA: hypothetical protein VJQ09_08500 [Candidatus Limnocylindria bacterium]|nr:hypothetical protein [Candidatus Limnocylindria bacterium]